MRRNQEVLFSGVQSQIFPVYREIGYRWFDEIPVDLCHALTSSFFRGTRRFHPGAGQKTENQPEGFEGDRGGRVIEERTKFPMMRQPTSKEHPTG